MGLPMSRLDADLQVRLDDQDATNPLFGPANRYTALNAAIQDAAAIIDKADEGYRVASIKFTSTTNQGEYQLPEDFERAKQVVDLDTDGTEKIPPRRHVHWVHRHRYASVNTLQVVPANFRSGKYYALRNNFLVLIPTPTQTSSYADVLLYYLPTIPDVLDGASEFPLPDFCRKLVVALAAKHLQDSVGEDTRDLDQEAGREVSRVEERVTPRTDDGPIRITDDLGEQSFGFGGW